MANEYADGVRQEGTNSPNIGVGSEYDITFGTGPGESTVFTGVTITDPSNRYAALRTILYSEYTVNTSNQAYCHKIHHSCTVNSGVTKSSDIYGVQNHCLRNYAGASADDNGTLSFLYAHFISYGNYNNNTSATPITSSARGLYIKGWNKTGTIGNMYDIYLTTDDSGGTLTELHYGIYQDASSVVNYFAGKVNLDNYVIQKVTVTTDNTDGADTYTAAQLLGKLIRRGTGNEITSAVIDITDTAANIVAAIPNCQVGSGFEFYVNNEDSTHTIQVDGGTGVTMAPNDPSTAIPANSTGHFMVVVTNATASSEAVTVHALGFSTH